MKNGIRITGIVLISLLYCYSIGVVNGYSVNSVPKKESGGNQAFYSSPDALSKLYDFPETKTSVNTFNNNLPSPVKIQFNEFWSIVKYRERFIFNKIIQVFSIEISILVTFQKTDIIFPFNYFW